MAMAAVPAKRCSATSAGWHTSSLSSVIYFTHRNLAGGIAHFVGSVSIADVLLRRFFMVYLTVEESSA